MSILINNCFRVRINGEFLSACFPLTERGAVSAEYIASHWIAGKKHNVEIVLILKGEEEVLQSYKVEA